MAKPVALSNGRSWKTQSAAKAHFKEILNTHRDGERVVDPQAHSDLLALVERYDRDEPSASRKAGVGVDHFFRDRDKEHNGLTSCFYVMRTDGSSIDFSIYRAVEVRPTLERSHQSNNAGGRRLDEAAVRRCEVGLSKKYRLEDQERVRVPSREFDRVTFRVTRPLNLAGILN